VHITDPYALEAFSRQREPYLIYKGKR